MQNAEIVVNNIVGDANTDPAAQSRTIARGLNKVGQLLRLGANALEQNAELEAKLAEATADPTIQVECPVCGKSVSAKQSRAVECLQHMVRVCLGNREGKHVEELLKREAQTKEARNEQTRLDGLVYGLRKDVERLEKELREMTDQRDSLLSASSVEAFRARLVKHLETGLDSARGPDSQPEFGKGWDCGHEAAIGIVRNFEKVRPNEAFLPTPPPPTPAPPPAPRKFQPGDRVRCIEANPDIALGEEGVISRTCEDFVYLKDETSKGKTGGFYARRFELIQEAPPATAPVAPTPAPLTDTTALNVKPGDRVLYNGPHYTLTKGKVYIVVSVTAEYGPWVRVMNDQGYVDGYQPKWFTLVGNKLTQENCKPGVKVVYVDDHGFYNQHFTRGQVYTVKAAGPVWHTDDGALLDVINNEGSPIGVYASRFLLAPTSDNGGGVTPSVLED